MKKLNLERLTVRLELTVKYFPMFRQARPDFFRELTTEKSRYNLNNQDKSYRLLLCVLFSNLESRVQSADSKVQSPESLEYRVRSPVRGSVAKGNEENVPWLSGQPANWNHVQGHLKRKQELCHTLYNVACEHRRTPKINTQMSAGISDSHDSRKARSWWDFSCLRRKYFRRRQTTAGNTSAFEGYQ